MGDAWRIEVADQGPGLSAEIARRARLAVRAQRQRRRHRPRPRHRRPHRAPAPRRTAIAGERAARPACGAACCATPEPQPPRTWRSAYNPNSAHRNGFSPRHMRQATNIAPIASSQRSTWRPACRQRGGAFDQLAGGGVQGGFSLARSSVHCGSWSGRDENDFSATRQRPPSTAVSHCG